MNTPRTVPHFLWLSWFKNKINFIPAKTRAVAHTDFLTFRKPVFCKTSGSNITAKD